MNVFEQENSYFGDKENEVLGAVPDTPETEAGGWLEPRSLRPAWQHNEILWKKKKKTGISGSCL
jgi:hypothetical protein